MVHISEPTQDAFTSYSRTFLVVETVEQWIKNLEPHANGRPDMLALREHYSGEGNASRSIATAERMREGLHYKNER